MISLIDDSGLAETFAWVGAGSTCPQGAPRLLDHHGVVRRLHGGVPPFLEIQEVVRRRRALRLRACPRGHFSARL